LGFEYWRCPLPEVLLLLLPLLAAVLSANWIAAFWA
jgi:hypothetical protein